MGCPLRRPHHAAFASTYGLVLVAAALIGMGSSVFHPESSRVARLASGGQHGLAQSVFQVGGNFGTALGPLLAAFIVLPYGQGSIAWFSVVALIAMIMLAGVGCWYGKTLKLNNAAAHAERARSDSRARRTARCGSRLGDSDGAHLLQGLLSGQHHAVSTPST